MQGLFAKSLEKLGLASLPDRDYRPESRRPVEIHERPVPSALDDPDLRPPASARDTEQRTAEGARAEEQLRQLSGLHKAGVLTDAQLHDALERLAEASWNDAASRASSGGSALDAASVSRAASRRDRLQASRRKIVVTLCIAMLATITAVIALRTPSQGGMAAASSDSDASAEANSDCPLLKDRANDLSEEGEWAYHVLMYDVCFSDDEVGSAKDIAGIPPEESDYSAYLGSSPSQQDGETDAVAEELEALRLQQQEAERQRRIDEQRRAQCERELAFYNSMGNYNVTPTSCM